MTILFVALTTATPTFTLPSKTMSLPGGLRLVQELPFVLSSRVIFPFLRDIRR